MIFDSTQYAEIFCDSTCNWFRDIGMYLIFESQVVRRQAVDVQ